MGKVVFCVVDEGGCVKDDVCVAVFDDMGDGKLRAAFASGVVASQRPEFVRVVGVKAVPSDDAEGGALEDVGLVGKGASDVRGGWVGVRGVVNVGSCLRRSPRGGGGGWGRFAGLPL